MAYKMALYIYIYILVQYFVSLYKYIYLFDQKYNKKKIHSKQILGIKKFKFEY